jgi:LysM repeat protein
MSEQGKHRQQSKAVRNIAKVALAGAVVSAPALIAATPANATNWDAIAQCESGGNWHTSTGNGFYGGLQFTKSTWHANGGTGNPANASRAEQIRVAKNVKASQGIGAWPVCGSRGGSSASYSHSSAAAQQQAPQQQQEQQAPTQDTTPAPTQQQTETQPAPAPAPTVSVQAPKSNPNGDYVVKQGDTLAKIAQAKGVQGGYHTLMQLNQGYIFNPDLILAGQKIATH